MPSRAHSSVVRRTLATPRRCPSMRGRPCRCAQRPLPSMMMAMCRGRAAGGHVASVSAAEVDDGLGHRCRLSHGRTHATALDRSAACGGRAAARSAKIVCSRSGPDRDDLDRPPDQFAQPVPDSARAAAGKSAICAHAGDVLLPAGQRLVDRLGPPQVVDVAGKLRHAPAVDLVGRADLESPAARSARPAASRPARRRRSAGPCSARPPRRTSRSAAAGA